MVHTLALPRSTPLLLLLATAVSAWAQSATTGGLSGTVTDAAGKGIPGAVVTLVHISTNQQLTAAAGDSGAYTFSMLAPGAYSARFAAKGFRTAQWPAIVITVSEAPTLDASLDAGEAAEPAPCRCVTSVTTSSTGTAVDSKAITAAPLTTRNITQVLSMTSGSAADVNNAGTLGRGNRNINVNGNTSAGAYSLDGAYAPSAVPNPDAISELKIQTSQYDAVFGAQTPTTALMTKSGENDLHGDFWEFVRNDIFNANSFFRNSTGQNKPHLKQNQFGVTLGGPVRRNKLFFFGSYQGTRQVNGLDTTSTGNVILPPLTEDRSAAALAAQFCPGNHLVGGQPDPRYLSFAGGKQLDCGNHATAATAPINPVALRILQLKKPDGGYLVPIPQTILTSGPNAGLGFSSYSQPSKYNEHQYLANADYLMSPRHSLTGRAYFTSIDQYRTFGSPQGYPGTAMVPGPGTPQALQARDYVASVGLTSTLRANLVNEARLAFTRTHQSAHGDQTPSATSVGMTPLDRFFDQLPETTILGPLGSFRVFGTYGNDFATRNQYVSVIDNFSWVHGRNRTRFGGVLFRQANWRDDLGNARGRVTFQTFSDFLLGLSAAENQSPAGRSNIQSIQANLGVGPQGQLRYDFVGYNVGLFVQDDFKVSQRLTLNLGLRWEYIQPGADRNGAIGNAWPELMRSTAIPPAAGTLAGGTVAANYNPDLVNPYTGQRFGPLPEGVVVRESKGFYRGGAPLDAFAPRFGFAWHPWGSKGPVSLRGGFGRFYQVPTYSGNASGAPLFTAQPFAQGFSNADASNGVSSWSKPFPDATLGWTPRTRESQLSDRVAGPEFRLPRMQMWNFSAQWRIGAGVSLDVGYVGSQGERLLIARGSNQAMLASPSQPVNCGYTGSAADCITSNTSKNARYRVPILGETPTALVLNEFAGSSAYHSMQTTLRRPASRGLGFQMSYTYSRAASNTSIYNDPENLSLDWARTAFDRTHRITLNFDYHLPAFSHRRGLRGEMLRGWSLAGIVIGQSGQPLTLTDPDGGSVYGRAATSTVTLCPGATYADLATDGSVAARLDRWIDGAAICAPRAIGADGATAYGTAGQGVMHGPNQFNTDFSLGKTTHVGGLREGAMLAFRMEFYNALNHPQFANPGTARATATFGVITQNSVAPRLVQFALKYLF
jgi:hypothetical protein